MLDMLWNPKYEESFFRESSKFASKEQLFYVTDDRRYVAYWPKGYDGTKSTLQSRNSLIGNFTEKWTSELIGRAIADKGLFAVQGAICDEIALPPLSPADVVISTNRNIRQKTEEILAIFEVKMSIVWNWEMKPNGELICIGDYRTHQGNPGLLRSDSMLKAIGKSINIRISSLKASKIPIIVIGNTPITNSYHTKVDHLKMSGIIQGFWSVNPAPCSIKEKTLKGTVKEGYLRIDNYNELRKQIGNILNEGREYFSGMRSKEELGKIIERASEENTYEKKAEYFLKMLRE
ncbi:MAG TPA: hypothetical protein PK733_04230 [Clostridiales bacterium]|nr:hypothetical protein [Clostridiales bacterium]